MNSGFLGKAQTLKENLKYELPVIFRMSTLEVAA